MAEELTIQEGVGQTIARTVELTIENNGLGINASQTFQGITVDFNPIQAPTSVEWDDVLNKPSDLVQDSDYVHTDNNFTDSEKTKLAGIEAGAEVNVIETVKVNGTALVPGANKAVDVPVPTTVAELSDASDYALVTDIPTKTSDLTNDGSDGTSTYIEESAIGESNGIAPLNQNGKVPSTNLPDTLKDVLILTNIVYPNGALYKSVNSDDFAINLPIIGFNTSEGLLKLDSNGRVSSSQLPSYVDDVIEAYPRAGQTPLSSTWLAYGSASGTVITPESGKIYVLMETSGEYKANSEYRWGGSAYVQLYDGGVIVDSALSDVSENPVQNKVVKAAVDAKADKTNTTTVISVNDIDGLTNEQVSDLHCGDIVQYTDEDDIVWAYIVMTKDSTQCDLITLFNGDCTIVSYEIVGGVWAYTTTESISLNDYISKINNPVSGNFAGLDANGNLIDSGSKASDFLTQHQDLTNYVQKSQTAGLLKNDGTVDTTQYGTYSKPSGGIPASDLASGVIPNVPVQDITVDNTSIVSSGVANIQTMTTTELNTLWNSL